MSPQPQQLSLLADFRPLPEPPVQRAVPAKPAVAVEAQKLSQADRVLQLLQDGRPWRTDRLGAVIYGPNCGLFRLAARVHELRKRGLHIDGWKAPENPKLHYYHLIKTEAAG